ncbi:MAG: hypothetical protein R2791_07320 [Saprospiraceae bacterium]
MTYSTSTQKSGETNKAAASSGDTKASAELYKVDIKETDKKATASSGLLSRRQ